MFCVFHAQSQQWTQLGDFPADGRDDGTSFVIGNKAWCGTGLTGLFEIRRDFYAFNFDTQAWEQASAMPIGQERQYAVGISFNNLGYVFGGINQSNFLNDLWEYDPASELWINRPSLPGAGRSGASGFIINQKLYIVGGKNNDTEALNEVWAYDFSTQSWTQKANLPFEGRWRASTVVIHDKIYLLFGKDENERYHNEIYQYNPDADEWSLIGFFPGEGRNYVDVKVINEQIFCLGGVDSLGTFHNDLWRYDPELNTWHQLSPLPAAGRRGSMSFTDGQSFYFSSGLNESLQRINETWKADQITFAHSADAQTPFYFYPNPAEQFIVVEYEKTASTTIEIFDTKGRLCYKQNIMKGTNTFFIDSLSPGVYFIRVNKGAFQKLLKS